MAIEAIKTTPLSNNYSLTAWFAETKVEGNTSTVVCSATLTPNATYWQSNHPSTLSIYWHDNNENYDRLVGSMTPTVANPQPPNYYQYGLNGGTYNDRVSISGSITVNHKSDGTLSGYAYAVFEKGSTTSGYAPSSGNVATDLTALTKITPITINSFTGNNIYGKFSATYTPVSGKSYTYGLRISIPNVVALVLYDNYVSGTEVTLSSSQINEIKSRVSGNTVTLGGVIEAYDGGTYVGESEELMISCSTIEENKARIRINGSWKEAKMYVRVNGSWKEAKPYIRVNNTWKEGI